MKVGYVAIVGKPNVGKSTLLNNLLGRKVSIVTPKPGTTRIRVLGVKNIPETAQIVFLDTPGVYHSKDSDVLIKAMNQLARQSLEDADVILFMIDAEEGWRKRDEEVFQNYVKPLAEEKPIILVINKVDRVGPAKNVLPLIEELHKKHPEFKEIVPISALKGANLDELEKTVLKYLPEGEPLFPEDMITDLPLRLLAAEIVREKVMLLTREEVPTAVAVVITEIKPGDADPNVLVIKGEIIVDRENLKPIIIGKKGQRLKQIGKLAREELELITNRKVYLELWVKVKPDWRKRPELVRTFGYMME
ncbi:GTP-binding protein Era [Hydrogenivirga caldilitoris]|uniref:GTPase Era n=1 Tax=Hydrogenivirga caldilitoris TaxID=246264 RepID=A0A497XPX7_9AQUI|nr:GTPase Era [Hydrogenivirga caldilitoris]RLJ70294.1 GTP-binding protein Era [Hydrogenivirga caldilitoris]